MAVLEVLALGLRCRLRCAPCQMRDSCTGNLDRLTRLRRRKNQWNRRDGFLVMHFTWRFGRLVHLPEIPCTRN